MTRLGISRVTESDVKVIHHQKICINKQPVFSSRGHFTQPFFFFTLCCAVTAAKAGGSAEAAGGAGPAGGADGVAE